MGKVQTEEQKQAIIIAAARAQRAIRKTNAILALCFVGALGYMFVRTAMALLATVQPLPDPESFSVARAPYNGAETLATSLGDAIAVDQPTTLREQGFEVLRPEQIRRAPEQKVQVDRQPQAGGAGSTTASEAFTSTVQAGDVALNQAFDYSKAVAEFEKALSVPDVPPFRREEAQMHLERAQVYLTITQGIVPLTDTSRIVRYAPPERLKQAAVLAAVPKATRNFTIGQVLITRLSDDALVSLAVTSEWKVSEITSAAEIRAAMAARIAARLKTLKQMKADGLAEPIDYVKAAIAILESGDVEAEGNTVRAKPLAHACLGEAFDMCVAENCSLAHTVLLRRDPEFLNFMTLQARLVGLDRQLRLADDAARAAAEAARAKELEEARRALGALLRRYPRAWDFRDMSISDTLDRMENELRQQAHERAQRQAERENQNPTENPPPINPASNEVGELLNAGRAAERRGDDLVGSTRRENFNQADTYATLSQAIEKYREALAYYRKAKDATEDAAEKASIETMITEVNKAMFWTRKSLPLR